MFTADTTSLVLICTARVDGDIEYKELGIPQKVLDELIRSNKETTVYEKFLKENLNIKFKVNKELFEQSKKNLIRLIKTTNNTVGVEKSLKTWKAAYKILMKINQKKKTNVNTVDGEFHAICLALEKKFDLLLLDEHRYFDVVKEFVEPHGIQVKKLIIALINWAQEGKIKRNITDEIRALFQCEYVGRLSDGEKFKVDTFLDSYFSTKIC